MWQPERFRDEYHTHCKALYNLLVYFTHLLILKPCGWCRAVGHVCVCLPVDVCVCVRIINFIGNNDKVAKRRPELETANK